MSRHHLLSDRKTSNGTTCGFDRQPTSSVADDRPVRLTAFGVPIASKNPKKQINDCSKATYRKNSPRRMHALPRQAAVKLTRNDTASTANVERLPVAPACLEGILAAPRIVSKRLKLRGFPQLPKFWIGRGIEARQASPGLPLGYPSVICCRGEGEMRLAFPSQTSGESTLGLSTRAEPTAARDCCHRGESLTRRRYHSPARTEWFRHAGNSPFGQASWRLLRRATRGHCGEVATRTRGLGT